jgi:hypothetical protein
MVTLPHLPVPWKLIKPAAPELHTEVLTATELGQVRTLP